MMGPGGGYIFWKSPQDHLLVGLLRNCPAWHCWWGCGLSSQAQACRCPKVGLVAETSLR